MPDQSTTTPRFTVSVTPADLRLIVGALDFFAAESELHDRASVLSDDRSSAPITRLANELRIF